jgi:hypothetical protein
MQAHSLKLNMAGHSKTQTELLAYRTGATAKNKNTYNSRTHVTPNHTARAMHLVTEFAAVFQEYPS